MTFVMTTLTQCMIPPTSSEMAKEAEAACQCAESWVTYGIGAKYVQRGHRRWRQTDVCSELTELLPHLYNLLPIPAASSALVEVLSESIFKLGKGAKILTEPLLAWFNTNFQAVLSQEDDGESSRPLSLRLLSPSESEIHTDDRTK